MATLPSSPAARQARIERISAVGVNESPITYQQQAYAWPGKRWKIILTYPPVREADVASWHQFFYDCNGREGTFNFNLDKYVKSTPAPGTVAFRLTSNRQGWDIDTAKLYGFVVEAEEVV